jgi:hypothetical protein
MIERLGRLGDRLLGAVLPRTGAAANHCWTVRKTQSCLSNCLRVCTRTCCVDGWCSAWSCGGCFC